MTDDEIVQPNGRRRVLPAPREEVALTPRPDDRQIADVVRRRPPRHRMRPARVVADHPAERAAAVRGGVGPEGEAVRRDRVPQYVQNNSGLHQGRSGRRVHRDERPHVAGEVEHDPGAGGLARDRGAAAARHHRHPVRPADRQDRRHVVGVARGDHTQRHPAVVRGVHRRQGAGGDAEVHATPYHARQLPLQLPRKLPDPIIRSICHGAQDAPAPWGCGRFTTPLPACPETAMLT